MDTKEAQQHGQQAQEWAKCDPFTVVEASKRSFYDEVVPKFQNQPELLGPIGDALARLEQITRALGTGVTSGYPIGGRSTS